MFDSETATTLPEQLWTYSLILIALGGPLVPFWYFGLNTATQFSLARLCVATVLGVVFFFVGVGLVERFTGESAGNIVLLDGLVLGFNAGVLLGKWAGVSMELSGFVGLIGALVGSFLSLDCYDWFVSP